MALRALSTRDSQQDSSARLRSVLVAANLRSATCMCYTRLKLRIYSTARVYTIRIRTVLLIFVTLYFKQRAATNHRSAISEGKRCRQKTTVSALKPAWFGHDRLCVPIGKARGYTARMQHDPGACADCALTFLVYRRLVTPYSRCSCGGYKLTSKRLHVLVPPSLRRPIVCEGGRGTSAPNIIRLTVVLHCKTTRCMRSLLCVLGFCLRNV